MSLIGRKRASAASAAFTELGEADVNNPAGSTDQFVLDDFEDDGTPTIDVTTPAVVQTGDITIIGGDVTVLNVSGFCLGKLVPATVTNVLSFAIASLVGVNDYIEARVSIRSGSAVNVYNLLFVGNGTVLKVYSRRLL